jgi:hypothetical protein
MKTCKICGQSKPIEDFYKSPNSPDGYAPRCKECKKAYIKEYRKTTKGKTATKWANQRWYDKRLKVPEKHLRTCKKCGERKSFSEFRVLGSGALWQICKECEQNE